MADEMIEYLHPTKYWESQSLEMLWAHLEEECNEALEKTIPLMRSMNKKMYNSRKEAAVELADVQIICNTILRKINMEPITESYKYNFCEPYRYRSETYALQIIAFCERRAKAAIEYRTYIRDKKGNEKESLYYSIKFLVAHAEALMTWLFDDHNERNNIRKLAYEKNRSRGYYNV